MESNNKPNKRINKIKTENEILDDDIQNLNINNEIENKKESNYSNKEKTDKIIPSEKKNIKKNKISEMIEFFNSNKKKEEVKKKTMYKKTLTETDFVKSINKREKEYKEKKESEKLEDEKKTKKREEMLIKRMLKDKDNKQKEEELEQLRKAEKKRKEEEEEKMKKIEKENKEKRRKEDEERIKKRNSDFNQQNEYARIQHQKKKDEEKEKERIQSMKKREEDIKKFEKEQQILEEEKRRKEEEERKRKEEEEIRIKEMERKRKEEEKRRKEEEERRIREEEERRIREEEEEKRRKEEEERRRKKEEEERKRKIKEEERRIREEEEERRRKEEEEEEEERKRREMEYLEKIKNQKERLRKWEEKQKKKREEYKNTIIENQKNFRKNNYSLFKTSNYNYYSNQTNNKLKQTLEHMCNYGNIVLKEIENDKKSIIKEYIYLDDLKYGNYSSDTSLFALNLLAQNLANNNIEAVIEKEPANISEDETITNLQFIVNGLFYKKKFTLSFDFGEENNEKILEEGDEYNRFIYELRKKISKDFGIQPDDIIITYLERGSVKIQVIFQSDEFNELSEEEFVEKFKNENEFPLLKCLKTIHSDVIMGACKLSKSVLDARGNRESGWGINEKRGNRPYNPPLGWIGIGLNVMDKYGDNTWIGMSNIPGEWCVAYHGVANNQSSDNVKDVTGKIIKGRFKKGMGQAHKNCPDKYHLGKQVGEGVYCTPNPGTAESYAGISEINGKKYKTILMVRVKPEAIRNCDKCSDSKNDNYWVIDGTTDEIRPYRILYKEY